MKFTFKYFGKGCSIFAGALLLWYHHYVTKANPDITADAPEDGI